MFRDAKKRLGDPVDAWAAVVEDPEKARAYKSQRGRGGMVRVSWEEAMEIVASAYVHTIKQYGPDRIAGFSVIPAMSMISYGAGARVPRTHRRDHAVLLRLVRGPAPGLAAGLRRPDRRARGRRLVQLAVPHHVGHEPAADPYPRRPLHGRGPLPRPEGRRRVPGLRGQHEVRGRLVARPARHGRCPGAGHGSRHPQGIPRRQARAHVPGLHDALHRLPVPRADRRGRRGRPRGYRGDDAGSR